MLSTDQHIAHIIIRYRRMLKYVGHMLGAFNVLNFIVATGSFTLSVYGS